MKRIITISRQFGSGGRSIAKEVAQRLGYTYYDKELVTKIAQESGLAEPFVQESGEYASARSSFLFNLSISAGVNGTTLPLSDQLYIAQHKVISEVAEKENCVIVGRCADYILRERTDCLHVLCIADDAFRMDRIVNLYGETDKSPEKRLHEKDEKRQVYYRHYTGRQWGLAENYHMCLNTGVLGVEECVELIVQAAKAAK